MAVMEKTSGAQLQASEAYVRSKQRKLARDITVKSLTYIGLILIGLTMFIPLVWMLSTSLKDSGSVFQFPPAWIPKPILG